jgi:hypothetical protein
MYVTAGGTYKYHNKLFFEPGDRQCLPSGKQVMGMDSSVPSKEHTIKFCAMLWHCKQSVPKHWP